MVEYNWLEIRHQLENLNEVGKQCITVTAFERYCRFHNISHPDITQFIDHMWGITQVFERGSFPEWEDGFGQMPLKGFGEPLPETLLEIIPEDLQEEFRVLTTWVSETTRYSWYAQTDPYSSSNVVVQVIRLVSIYEIDLPCIMKYLKEPRDDNWGWGPMLSDEEVAEWRSWV